jgi:hypothetical protein
LDIQSCQRASSSSCRKNCGYYFPLIVCPDIANIKVGEPTTTIVGEVGDDVSACCEGSEVAVSALLLTMLSLPAIPL